MFDFAEDAADNPTFYSDLHEPQSLNKYQYCYNNPLRFVDPDAHGIKTASENSGANWSQPYGYDRYGNRWVSAASGYTLSSLTPTTSNDISATNNRIVMGSSHYDPAGNLDVDAQNRTFTYDAENRQITFNGAAGQYFYDGDGRRVKKIDSSGTTIFVYNAGGQLIAEYSSDPVPTLAGEGGTSYLTTDHLGSTRVVTKQDGSVKARYDYLPYGEDVPSSLGARSSVGGYGVTDGTRQKFTQKERDSESGLDYFLARYYSSAQGRFTSPDEFSGGPDELFDFAEAASDNPTFYADLTDPQSLNKYQYCYNNPLLYIDPTGHQGGLKKLFDKAVAAGKQVVADTVNGAAKTAYNAVISGRNTVNALINDGLSLTGTSFRFRTYEYAQPSTTGEKSAMLAGDIVLLYVAAKAATPSAGVEASPRVPVRAAESSSAEVGTPATQPYKRPSGATTAAQRASVQGQPCVECGKTAPKMVANHKTPLVKEYYQTGRIDTQRMRQVSAVNSHCTTCSAREGAQMSRYSRDMRGRIRIED